MVEAYERINRDDFPVRDRRPSITHASFMSAEAIAKMQALGIVADLQPAWLYLDGANASSAFRSRAARLLPPVSHALREGGDGRRRLRSHAENRQPPFDQSLQSVSSRMWTTIVRQPRGTKAPLQSRTEPDARAGDPSLYDQQRVPDVRGDTQGFARAGQARRLHRARPRHPHLPGR